MRKIQIGIMGSAADLNYSVKAEDFASEVGKIIAQKNCTLIYGAEKDSDSLSSVACRSANKFGGLTVGITYGKTKDIWGDYAPTVTIPCGLERGGGREFTLVLSCDAVIAISGGSGTLTEIAVAYQANIPIIVVDCFGGWAQKLSGQFLDERKRQQCFAALTPLQAVEMAIEKAKENLNNK